MTVVDELFRGQWRSYPATQLITKGEAVQFLPQLQVIWAIGKCCRRKNGFLFSGTRMATQSMKAERKINRVYQLTLDLHDCEWGQWDAMAMCILIALVKKNLSWLGVIGREMQAVPCQVCLPSTSAVISYARSVASPVIPLSAHLTWWTCLANPSGGGRSGKWGSLLWVIGKKKLLASHTLQLFILLPPSLIIMIIRRKQNEWLGDVILWVCG